MAQMSKPTSSTARWDAADYAANSAVQQTWARELIARLKLRDVIGSKIELKLRVGPEPSQELPVVREYAPPKP